MMTGANSKRFAEQYGIIRTIRCEKMTVYKENLRLTSRAQLNIRASHVFSFLAVDSEFHQAESLSLD